MRQNGETPDGTPYETDNEDEIRNLTLGHGYRVLTEDPAASTAETHSRTARTPRTTSRPDHKKGHSTMGKTYKFTRYVAEAKAEPFVLELDDDEVIEIRHRTARAAGVGSTGVGADHPAAIG